MRLCLHTRRWFCDIPSCPHRIFTERLSTVALPQSRHTTRLVTIAFVFGAAVGGAPGTRLLQELGIAVSGETLRRAVRVAELPDAATPCVLGVDDWSRRESRTFGTILVDLERRRPIDLLPDGSAATFAPWLPEHARVEIISCDRGGVYAEGARQGAPHAVQVADRWHHLKNLSDMLERVLVRDHDVLRHAQLRADAPVDQFGVGRSAGHSRWWPRNGRESAPISGPSPRKCCAPRQAAA